MDVAPSTFVLFLTERTFLLVVLRPETNHRATPLGFCWPGQNSYKFLCKSLPLLPKWCKVTFTPNPFLLLQLKTCLVMVQGIQSQTMAIWWVNTQRSQEFKYLLFHHDISCVKCWRRMKQNKVKKKIFKSTKFWISASSAIRLMDSGRRKPERAQPIHGRQEEEYPYL